VQLISTGDLAPSGDLAGERVGDESDATSLDIIHLESMGVNDQGRRADICRPRTPPHGRRKRTAFLHRKCSVNCRRAADKTAASLTSMRQLNASPFLCFIPGV